MPTGIYKRKPMKEETKIKIGLGNIGNKSWLGKHHTKEWKIKMLKINTGSKHSKEAKEKIKKSWIERKKNGWKRPKETIETRLKKSVAQRGEKSSNWKGGVGTETMKIRSSFEYKLWRESVFKRDNWTCVWCKRKGIYLQADHIQLFSVCPELRFAIDNGRTLCKECHYKRHRKSLLK